MAQPARTRRLSRVPGPSVARPDRLDHHATDLKQFWPTGGPHWDALAVIDLEGALRPGVLLLEGKSYPEELYGSGCQAEARSREHIGIVRVPTLVQHGEEVLICGPYRCQAAPMSETCPEPEPHTSADPISDPDQAAGDAQPSRASEHGDIPLFGARKRAKELSAEAARLREQLERVGALSLLEVEERRAKVSAEIEQETERLEQERRDAAATLQREREEATAQARQELSSLQAEQRQLDARLSDLRADVVETEEVALLQEAGVYEYRHPLSDAVA